MVKKIILLSMGKLGKVTKAFSYSFNVSHVTPSSLEGVTGKISGVF